jgi:isopentenyl-diphosphate delta-isomerase
MVLSLASTAATIRFADMAAPYPSLKQPGASGPGRGDPASQRPRSASSMTINARKAEHLQIAAEPGIEHRSGTGLDAIRLRHRALPERDLAAVELGTSLFGARLDAPLIVNAMTGGTAAAAAINESLATAAAEHGVGMVLGSGRALLADRSLLDTYRRNARPPLLIANLGAVGLTPEAAARLVEMLGADALSVHVNPLQEAIQPEGQPHYGDVLEAIVATVAALAPLPVIVKEVGFGMDAEDVRALARAGVTAVDVAGAGGTNWALIEGRRDERAGALAAAFADWGAPTARAVAEAVSASPGLPVIASGGLRDGVDVAKCLALGATAGALARPMLTAAQDAGASGAIATLIDQLRIAVWACGAASAADMDASRLQS